MEDKMDLLPIVKSSAGLDVHLKNVVVTVLKTTDQGESKETVREFSTFPKELGKLASWLREENVELAVMESTGIYWKSVFEALETECIKTFVVNAQHVKQIPGKKTDISDSKWLATLARYGLVKGSFIPKQELRDLRLVTRYRIKLKGTIASEVNRMHKILNDAGIRLSLVFSDIQCVSAMLVIEDLIKGEPIEGMINKLKGASKKKEQELREALVKPLRPHHKFLLTKITKHIKHMNQECVELDREIFAAMQPYKKQWQLLQTIPGVDQLSAAIIIAEIGVDIKQQFQESEKFCAWAGVSPGNNESAGKRKSACTVKGSSTLRKVLCEVANSASKTRSQFQGYYKSLQIRRGRKRTIIAIAHKIMRVIFSLFNNSKPYFDPHVNYEKLMVERNAPRWLECLTKYGYIKCASA